MCVFKPPTPPEQQGCLGKEMAAAVASGLVAASVAAPGCPIVPGLLVAPTEQAAVAKAADAPVAWVAAAMGVAKQGGEQEAVAFTVVPTGAAVTTTMCVIYCDGEYVCLRVLGCGAGREAHAQKSAS